MSGSLVSLAALTREELLALPKGTWLWWRRVSRGGYGYVTRVPVVLAGVGPAKIRVIVRRLDGTAVLRSVKPSSLSRIPAGATSPASAGATS